MTRYILALLAVLAAAGCATGAPRPPAGAEREMTVGLVQKEIHAGLRQEEVILALGSPNIVTRDASGNDTWVYDKIASEASYSRTASYGTILVLGGTQSAGATATSQKTLTVVIKFGPDQRVQTFTYHASRF